MRFTRAIPFTIGLTLSAAAASAALALEQVIPLDTSGPRLKALLTVEGHAPVPVIFDTGAMASIINPKLATELGMPNLGNTQVHSPGSSSPVEGFLTRFPKARLGEADITGRQALAIDIKLPLGDVLGIMSPNLFAGKLVRFELSKSRAAVTDRSSATIPAGQAYSYAAGLPAAEINIAGTKIEGHVDSGAGAAFILPLEEAQKLPLADKLVPHKPIHVVGADHNAFTAHIKGSVAVGPAVFDHPEMIFAENIPFAVIGFAALRNLTIVLDPSQRRDWLLKAD